jgi:hypothetical protein
MTCAELLADAFGRVREVVHRVVDGLSPGQLAVRIDPAANSIAWLVWHLTRAQDDHLADAFQAEQVWTSRGWVERLGLPFDPRDTGCGHQADDVAAVQWPRASCWWATTTRSTSRPSRTWASSPMPTLAASWTGPGTRR